MGSASWPLIPAGVQPMGPAEAQGGSALPVCTLGTGGSGRLKLRAVSRRRRVVARAGFGFPGGFFQRIVWLTPGPLPLLLRFNLKKKNFMKKLICAVELKPLIEKKEIFFKC